MQPAPRDHHINATSYLLKTATPNLRNFSWCAAKAASLSFSQADPTEDTAGHVPSLSWVIFRGQKKPGRQLALGGVGGTPGLLQQVPSFAWALWATRRVIGGRGLPSSAPNRRLQNHSSPHPGTFICESYCVIKPVLLKQMGTPSIQMQQLVNTLQLHVLRQWRASVWCFCYNRLNTYEDYAVVKNQKSRCFSFFLSRAAERQRRSSGAFLLLRPLCKGQGIVLKVIGFGVSDKIICLLLNSMGYFSCSHLQKPKFGSL